MGDLSAENWEKLTFPNQIRKWVKKYSGRIAIKEGNKSITYFELEKSIAIVQKSFLENGVAKGDKIAIYLANSSEFIIILLALLSIGAVPILFLENQGKNEVESIIEFSKPKMFIYNEKKQVDIGRLKTNLIELQYMSTKKITNTIENIDKIINDQEYSAIYSDDVKQSDLAVLLLSGGTTGIPKLIPRTHGDYIYNISKINERLNIEKNDIYLSILPMAHNFGLGNPGILGTMMSGGKVVICNEVAAMEIFSLIEKEKATFTSLVPSILKVCLEYRKIDETDDISSLKMILVGGAPLKRSIAEEVDILLKSKLIQVYGIAEGLICTNYLNDSLNTRVSCQGRPISEYDLIKIVNLNGDEVSEGESGELITKGPYTIHEYYELVDSYKYFNNEGYYCTGDEAVKLSDGSIKIVGRIREQINRSGEKIIPSELECVINEYYKVKDCVVIGTDDEFLGNRISVYAMSNEKFDINELNNFLRRKGIAEYKLPDTLKIVKDFPYTPVGKIDKKSLLQG